MAVLGDGCFHMTVGEINVARRRGLAVPHIVLNDGWLSLIKIEQDRRGFDNAGFSWERRLIRRRTISAFPVAVCGTRSRWLRPSNGD